MERIDSTLFHLVEPPRNPAGKKYPAIILLHGLGANEEDLLGLSSSLDERFLIISVRAPFPSQFSGGYTWYDIGEVGRPEPAKFTISYSKLSQFVDDALRGYPVNPEHLYLLGFSMGSVMAYALSLTRPSLFRGVVANSGYLAEGTHLSYQWDQLDNVNFFVAHGTQDPVIPVTMARHAKEQLENAHARLDYREYPMAHQISEESLQDSSRWLTHHLNSLP